MTSKERVLTALARREPDRVPINYSANEGIDRRLKAHFGLAPDDGAGLAVALGVDFRSVGAPYRGPMLHPDLPASGVKVDNYGIHRRWIEHASGGYWDFCDFPLRDADEETIANWPMPSPDDYDYTVVRQRCRDLKEYCVTTGGAGLADIINSTGMISLDMFRRHIRPRHQRFVDLAKSFRLPILFHSCGSSSWAFGDFIEMGIDAVDTLQPEAKDMAPQYLKSTFGARLAFHGCISTAGPVATGSVQQTIDYCRRTLEIMMPGGGYCFAPTHALQDNSPTANVLDMYRTALDTPNG